jgi:hypothetical protein
LTGLLKVLGLGLCVAGCASSNETPLQMPELPSVASISAIGAGTPEHPLGSATDLYARIGRGAVSCWFGANGPLKLSYIYHAEAEPPSRGGKAEIIIHQREPGQPNPRGAKAYRIAIEPAGETATLATENYKLPQAMAKGLNNDVERWSKGETGCASAASVAAWAPKAPEPAPAETPKGSKARSKTAGVKPAKP